MKTNVLALSLVLVHVLATNTALAEDEKPKLVVMPLQTSSLPEAATATLDELLVDFVQ